MRDAFHDELDSIGQTLIDMGHLVGTAVQLATTALLTADLKIAEQVISEDIKIDNMQHELAHHIAKVARMRFPSTAVPPELVLTIQEMSDVLSRIITKTTGVLRTHDLESAIQLEKDDDEMDKLHRKLFLILLDDAWPHGIETAIDMTLLGRYYERCADHAVSVCRRVYFLVTGEYASEQA